MEIEELEARVEKEILSAAACALITNGARAARVLFDELESWAGLEDVDIGVPLQSLLNEMNRVLQAPPPARGTC